MIRSRLHLILLSVASTALLFSPLSAKAQSPGPAARQRTSPQSVQRALPPPTVRTPLQAEDARETKARLHELLRQYSPNLGAVLKLDPTLLTNPDYLAPYPGLADFVALHPEVARDPAYFFEDVDVPWHFRAEPMTDRQQVVALWRNFLEGFMIFFVLVLVASTLVWLIKTLIDYRRWARLSKVQADVHNKVLDRFTNNEELLAYVQTPAGRRFLESAPIALEPATGSVSAPLRRILWSVEAGFVLVAAGIGLQYVSGHVPTEVSPMPFALGVLAVAIGIGFVVAAAVSFLISKRLGLFQAAAPQMERGA